MKNATTAPFREFSNSSIYNLNRVEIITRIKYFFSSSHRRLFLSFYFSLLCFLFRSFLEFCRGSFRCSIIFRPPPHLSPFPFLFSFRLTSKTPRRSHAFLESSRRSARSRENFELTRGVSC